MVAVDSSRASRENRYALPVMVLNPKPCIPGTGTESDTALPEDAAVLEESYSASEGSERPEHLAHGRYSHDQYCYIFTVMIASSIPRTIFVSSLLFLSLFF